MEPSSSQSSRTRRASARPSNAVRVVGRVRPTIGSEEDETYSLRVISGTQLEVLLKPRAALSDPRGVPNERPRRRRTIGGERSPRTSFGCSHVDIDGTKPVQTDVVAALAAQVPARLLAESRTFSFDTLFDGTATDDEVFGSVQDEIAAAVHGETVAIFAYGTTGSGKTHTVTNLAERTAKELEKEAARLQEVNIKLEILVQIVEIYNDQLRDLMRQDASQEPPRIRMQNGRCALQGTTLWQISNDGAGGTGGIAGRLQDALRFGQAQRATSATAMHRSSSRSHLVMTLYLAVTNALTGSQQMLGRLSLVDLAGSERLKSSQASGHQLTEAQHINRSLSALADVVAARERASNYVPYRNSKLTYLLQDALGGQSQSRTVIIVNLRPTRCLGETLHSLQFSSRLMSISSTVSVALVPIEEEEEEELSLLGSREGLPRGPLSSELRELRELAELRIQLRETELLRAQLEERDNHLEERDQQIEDKDQRIEELERLLEERNRLTEVLERKLAEAVRELEQAQHDAKPDVQPTSQHASSLDVLIHTFQRLPSGLPSGLASDASCQAITTSKCFADIAVANSSTQALQDPGRPSMSIPTPARSPRAFSTAQHADDRACANCSTIEHQCSDQRFQTLELGSVLRSRSPKSYHVEVATLAQVETLTSLGLEEPTNPGSPALLLKSGREGESQQDECLMRSIGSISRSSTGSTYQLRFLKELNIAKAPPSLNVPFFIPVTAAPTMVQGPPALAMSGRSTAVSEMRGIRSADVAFATGAFAGSRGHSWTPSAVCRMQQTPPRQFRSYIPTSLSPRSPSIMVQSAPWSYGALSARGAPNRAAMLPQPLNRTLWAHGLAA